MAAPKLDSSQSLQLLKAYIQNALTAKSSRTSTSTYNSLVDQIRALAKQRATNESAATTFVRLLEALNQCLSLVDERDHEALLSATFSVNLWTCHPTVGRALMELATNLVSVNGALVHVVMYFLVSSFVPAPDAQQAAIAGGAERTEEVTRGPHMALDRILRLVPTAASRLLPLVVQQWPHKRKDQYILCTYLQGVFRVAEGAAGEAMMEPLLGSIVDKLIEIDVEIRWEDISDIPGDEDGDEGGEEGVFELDELEIHHDEGHGGFGVGSPATGGARPGHVHGGGPGAKPPVDETADKLDSMMELTFAFLERQCAGGGCRRVFDALLASFERTLLHTHRSKFTQFLLFFVASRDTKGECSRILASFLGERLLAPGLPTTTRLAAAAYLASFLARASFAPLDATCQALSVICQWGLGYAADQDLKAPRMHKAASGYLTIPHGDGAIRRATSMSSVQGGGADGGAAAQEHVVYYAAVQAVLYVLCYRMGALSQAGPALQQQLKRLPVQELLLHRLSPLASVLPTIAHEFAVQCGALGLFGGEDALLQAAAGGGGAGGGGAGGGGAGAAAGGGDGGGGRGGIGRPLEMFFPFDPYLLRRSSRFLELRRSYTTWRAASGWAHGGPANSASHQESGGHDDDDDDDEDDGEATSGGSDDSFDEANERMSSMEGTPVSHPSSIGMNGASYGAGSLGVTPPRFGVPKGPAFGFGRPQPISHAAAQMGHSYGAGGTPMSCTPEGYLGSR